MAKRKKTEEPKPPTEESAEEPVQGFPEHDEPYKTAEEHDEPPPSEPEPEPELRDDPVAELRSEMQELRRENQELRQMIPPAQQPQQEPQPKAGDEPDWERLLFDNPNEALKLHGERVREQVRKELQEEYQRDQGTRKFWTDFYKKHPDLEEDRDLVELTLNSNLNKLANLPVSEAIEQLADLTRQRILRYSGNQQQKRGKKAFAEGAEPPKAKAPPKEEPKVTSLSDLIKARKGNRTTAA